MAKAARARKAKRRRRAAPKTAATARTWLSPARYAEWRKARGLEGGTRQAVRKAIEDGRLRSAERSGGRWRVCAELADVEWEQASNPSARGRKAGGGAARRDPTGGLFDPAEQAAELAKAAAERQTHSAAQARRLRVQAELAELELRQRTGRVVDADAARREAFDVAHEALEALMLVPDRAAPFLVGKTSPAEVHAILVREIVSALEGLQRWTAEPAP